LFLPDLCLSISGSLSSDPFCFWREDDFVGFGWGPTLPGSGTSSKAAARQRLGSVKRSFSRTAFGRSSIIPKYIHQNQ
jgi:hypothetical protein